MAAAAGPWTELEVGGVVWFPQMCLAKALVRAGAEVARRQCPVPSGGCPLAAAVAIDSRPRAAQQIQPLFRSQTDSRFQSLLHHTLIISAGTQKDWYYSTPSSLQRMELPPGNLPQPPPLQANAHILRNARKNSKPQITSIWPIATKKSARVSSARRDLRPTQIDPTTSRSRRLA
eukprot:7542609-Pyramimonas_sp.AAC.1